MNLNRLRAEAMVALTAARLEEAQEAARAVAYHVPLLELDEATRLLQGRVTAARAAHAAAVQVAEELGR